MVLSLLLTYYVLKELICEGKYKKMKFKIKYKNARSANIGGVGVGECCVRRCKHAKILHKKAINKWTDSTILLVRCGYILNQFQVELLFSSVLSNININAFNCPDRKLDS